MSGSSLDGIDLSYARYDVYEDRVEFELLHTEHVAFSEKWETRLRHVHSQDALTFIRTHVYFGHYLGEILNDFIHENGISPDFIASHGHTIFHDPNGRITTQIGDGAAIAAITNQTVICDFRTLDIAIDGEGTPIAPAADRYLFSDYDFCMNIGGIANITHNNGNQPIAFDIAPANQVLNALAGLLGWDYDEDGNIAKRGRIQPEILERLSDFMYFSNPYPKSISNSWIRNEIIPIYMNAQVPLQDKLRTAVEHLVQETYNSIQQIIEKEGLSLEDDESYQLLATGGGVFNDFLMDTLSDRLADLKVEVVVPDDDVIEYKEAILMGLMGVLRMENRPNCFKSVTGAQRDTIGGAIYKG